MWFDKDNDHWSISSTGSKEGKVIAPSDYFCPSRIGSNWQYYDDSKDLKNAGDEIKVTCSGALVDDIWINFSCDILWGPQNIFFKFQINVKQLKGSYVNLNIPTMEKL